MENLIERLHEATGPDRALATAVLLACGWTTNEIKIGVDTFISWETPDGYEFDNGVQPDPTASFDDAVALAPGWLQWERRGDRVWVGSHSAAGATPAIALCIAILHARMVPSRPSNPNFATSSGAAKRGA